VNMLPRMSMHVQSMKLLRMNKLEVKIHTNRS